VKKELKVAADVGKAEDEAGHTVASEVSEDSESSSGEESEEDAQEQGEGSQGAESEGEDGVDNLGEKLIRFKSPNLMNQMLPHAIA
jgi:hypothetical protein